ncbi:hypothetical protein [Thalassospira alkalitolerans]|uniref:hypothetical protein n=1 Tax=Thalassospira alkalitolerans TaxID=1293890 RepID=UPI00111C41AC|nr:hypothetical protein [Thalassospira alkalitolerans]
MNRAIPHELLTSIQKSGLHKPDHCAFVLDFSGVPATRSRTVFCSFLRYFEYGCAQNLTSRLLSDHAISLLMPLDQREIMSAFIDQLNFFLLSRRYGAMDVRVFDLNHETSEFAICCVEYMRATTRETAEDFLDFYQAPPKSAEQLGQLVEIERIVGQADMSMHIRMQPIWLLQSGLSPEWFGEEFWVSMAAMEEITGKDILRDDWMFARFTELLDNRVLSHITKEPYSGDAAQFLNLNPVAVVSANFRRMVKTLPARQLRKLTVEISHLMWRNNPKVRKGIQNSFDRYGIKLAFDQISIQKLPVVSPAEIDIANYLKLNVFDLGGEEIEAILRDCSEELIRKIVFCRCETMEQIQAGVNAGVKYFQGYGMAKFLNNPDAIESVLGRGAANNIAPMRFSRKRL